MRTNFLFGLGVAAFLCAPLVGCGGSVESSSTGTSTSGGGQGGSGGTSFGGTGPGGGGTEGTCTDEQLSILSAEPGPLGFSTPPPDNMGATIVSVSPTVIEYTLDGTGESGKFLWKGPDLTASFQAGSAVAVGVQEGWQFIAFDKVAAVRVDYDFVPPGSVPAVPMSKAPMLIYSVECTFEDFVGGCGQEAGIGSLLGINIGSAPDTLLVSNGETDDVGAFYITNVISVAVPGYSSSNCVVEAFFSSTLTVLGPVGK